jgi:starch phosphorylase
MLLLPRDIAPKLESLLKQLQELATDLRWTWSHAGDEFWHYLDPVIWRTTRNPYALLQKLSITRLDELSIDPKFVKQLASLSKARKAYLKRSGWAQQHFTSTEPAQIAYFSMEFGLGEALPLYAGGLGILAGDYLKTASDLGAPIIGIGLLYDEGYFRQYLDSEGWQQEIYPHNDTRNLPLQPVLTKDGTWLNITLNLPGRDVFLRVWQAQVGRSRLYLLDSNDPQNNPIDQGITGKLYGGSGELRLIQEIVLGIGGWRIIQSLKLPVKVCHLNEGHAAFATVERARCFMQQHHTNFWEALWATRGGNIFTTHTPVAAAFDTFPASLLERYGNEYVIALGISPEELLALGKLNPLAVNEPFNMAYFAARTCARVNGVSQLHGEVSRQIFAGLYPRWPLAEIPIGHITNGIHVPTWDSATADNLWTQSCGKERWLGVSEPLGDAINQLSDEQLWSLRGTERADLVHYVRRRLNNRQGQWFNHEAKGITEQVELDPNILTLGFARRFTEYKRPNLLLYDQQRLIALLNNAEKPLQIIVAGKAHPQDHVGKGFIQQWYKFLQRPEVRSHVIFLEDYDIRLAQHLVQGVDVWLNTPRRLWEACGTSGMKVLVNGGLNISTLDGWWAEAYGPNIGWALGDDQQHQESDWDATLAQQLYDLLEDKVIPTFYKRDASGIPLGWVQMMRSSMSQLTQQFSSNRMLGEYIQKLYLPALKDYACRSKESGALARSLYLWESRLRLHGAKIHWGDLRIEENEDCTDFAIAVYFGDVLEQDLFVQLYADPLSPNEPGICQNMLKGEAIAESLNGFVYRLRLKTQRPFADFTPRVIPRHESVQIPAELNVINWWSGSTVINAGISEESPV